MMKNSLAILTLSLTLLLSCNNKDLYFQYADIPISGWDKDSAITFNLNIEDTVGLYNQYINVRNRGEYPHQNLWLFIEKTTPDSVISLDTINFYLADLKGKWLGAGVGSVYEMPILYQQNIKFEQKGDYQFKIIQGMRDDKLIGISNIGLRIENVNS